MDGHDSLSNVSNLEYATILHTSITISRNEVENSEVGEKIFSVELIIITKESLQEKKMHGAKLLPTEAVLTHGRIHEVLHDWIQKRISVFSLYRNG
ncbi:hypothetical protein TNCT_225261 [Trichonephila clavata]|uniref:Uncharacterized protein n=1 Tax=Trichonephila clavata TaxID=2740835 RepID=A0A8X6H979_TRICU|nr:hypothetical protein TNCT_225261 [Trichonephila clavata]